jgi:hypothetical protein
MSGMPAAHAQPPHEDEPAKPVQQASFVRIWLSRDRMELQLHVAYPATSSLAFMQTQQEDFACSVLRDLPFNGDKPLCSFLIGDQIGLNKRFSRAGDLLHVDLRRSLIRHDLNMSFGTIWLCTPAKRQLPQVDRLIVTLKDPLFFSRLDPVPLTLDGHEATFANLSRGCGEGGAFINIRNGAPNQPATADDPTFQPLSFRDMMAGENASEIGNKIERAAKFLAPALLMALPAVLLLSLLNSVPVRRHVDQSGRKAAKRLCWLIAALAWLPFMATQWESGLSVWYKSPVWDAILPAKALVTYDLKEPLGSGLIGLISIVVLILPGSIASIMLGRLLRTLAWRPDIVTWRVVLISGLGALGLVIVGTAAMAAGRMYRGVGEHIPYELFVILACAPLAFLLIASVASALPSLTPVRTVRMRWIAILMVSILLVYPFRASVSSRDDIVPPWDALVPGALNAIVVMAPIAATLIVIPAIWLLRSLPDDGWGVPEARQRLGALLFGAFAVGSDRWTWAMLVAALLSISVLWPRLICAPRYLLSERRRNRREIEGNARNWADRLARTQDLRESLRGPKLREKLSSGEWKPSEWAEKRALLDDAYAQAVDALRLKDGTSVRSLILTYATEPTRWGNAWRSLVGGLPWIAFIVFLQATKLYAEMPGHPQPQLIWVSTLLGALSVPIALALLFGYFFEDIRGSSGLNKALWFALAIGLSRIPALLTTGMAKGASAALVWTVGQQSLLLILIGVFGFDYARMRKIQGRLFDWRRFTWFGDAQLLSTGVLTTAAALAPVIGSLVNDKFASALVDGLKAALPLP